MKKNLLALDLGAESGRALVGTVDGKTISLEEAYRFPTGFDMIDGRRRWNMPRLLEELRTGIRTAAERADIASMAIDSWGVDGGFIDADGKLCGLPYAYRDFDVPNMEVAQKACGGADRIYEITGIQHMPFNSLYQFHALARRSDPVLANARRFLMIPDLLLQQLSGHEATEETDASTTQLVDVRKRDWSDELLNAIGVDRSLFMPIGRAGVRTGVKIEGTDIEAITTAGHDTACAVVAVPATTNQRWAFISSGTWSIFGVESATPMCDERACALNVSNEGGINGTYRVLKNIMGLWILQECRKSFAKAGDDHSYAELVELAAAAPPFQQLIDVDDLRFMAPDDMLTEINGHCADTGQAAPAGIGAAVRCVMESLALRYAETLAAFNELLPEPVEALHVIGGGSQNRLLNQMTASACGIPVISGPVEATGMGNMIVQLIATGELSGLAEGRQMVAASCELERFEPEDTAAWRSALAGAHWT